jgi:hypothetical protein
MTKLIAALSLATALAIASATVPAAAQTPDQKPVAVKKHHVVKQRVAARYPGSRHIACTFLGCQPVPANCIPVTQYTSDGMPTGYDAIACR